MRSAKYSVIAIGVALIAIMVFVLFFIDSDDADISWRTIAVEVGDPRQVTVTFEVDKPPLASAECQVAAFDAKDTTAGRLTRIGIGPSAGGSRTTRMTVVVITPIKTATSAAVATCQLTRTR